MGGASNGRGGQGSAESELRIAPPPGLEPGIVQVVAMQIATDLHAWFPLMPNAIRQQVIQGCVNDLPRIMEKQQQVIELLASPGSMWGMQVAKRSPILQPGMPGAVENPTGFEIALDIRQCKSAEDMLRWAGVYGVMTNPSLRALIAVQGYQLALRVREGVAAPGAKEEAKDD